METETVIIDINLPEHYVVPTEMYVVVGETAILVRRSTHRDENRNFMGAEWVVHGGMHSLTASVGYNTEEEAIAGAVKLAREDERYRQIMAAAHMASEAVTD